MKTFQSLIQEAVAGDSKEEDRYIELHIRIRTHGKLDQCWKAAQSMWRHLRVISGNSFSFHLLNGEEITDDYSDDEEEMWHSLDWKGMKEGTSMPDWFVESMLEYEERRPAERTHVGRD